MIEPDIYTVVDSLLVSDLKVMQSRAGWYIGRSCIEDGIEMPYSRESGYYPNPYIVQTLLDEGTWEERDCAEKGSFSISLR